MEQDHDKFRALNSEKNEILKEMEVLSTREYNRMKNDPKEVIKAQHNLQEKLQEVRSKAAEIIKRQRCITSSFKTGLTGVEEPGDHPNSNLYHRRNDKLSCLKRRDEFYSKNRLKRKCPKNKNVYTDRELNPGPPPC